MNQSYEVDIVALAYGGAGIAKIDGKVCFVEGGLPGEKVRVSKTSEKRKFILSKVIEVLKRSDERVEPKCKYYDSCGGCQYQHLKYESELEYKQQQLKDALSRIGGIEDCNIDKIISSKKEYAYRSSITIHKTKGGYGYFSKDNITIIPINNCPLASESINKSITSLQDSNPKKDVTLKEDYSNNVWITGYPGHRFFKDSFLGLEISFSPLAFSQINREVAIDLVKKMREWVSSDKNEVLFDLYCGVGFFGFLLRDLFNSVIGIEESGIAIDCAKTTKKDLGLENIKFYEGSVDLKFQSLYDKYHKENNTIIVDPPRSGLNKRMTELLRRVDNTQSLLYISCNPATLSRDAKALTQENRWILKKIAPLDMFPRTKHIEALTLFTKNGCKAN